MTLKVRSAPKFFGDPVRNTDGETVGHLIRRVKPIYSYHQNRVVRAGGFAVIDLDGAEIAWAATYMQAVSSADGVLQDRSAA